jgi:hypothetical protein
MLLLPARLPACLPVCGLFCVQSRPAPLLLPPVPNLSLVFYPCPNCHP